MKPSVRRRLSLSTQRRAEPTRSVTVNQTGPRRRKEAKTYREACHAATDDEDALVGVLALVWVLALVKNELAVVGGKVDVGESVGG